MANANPSVATLLHRQTGPVADNAPRPRRPEELASWPTRMVQTSEGPLCFVTVPPRRGWPTVALLHGWAMNRSAWAQAALPLVDAGFGVLIPDLAGHGGTPDLDGELGERAGDYFERMARQVDEAAAALGHDQLAVAGYSMGSMVALAWSRIAPERVERLMLLDPIVRIPALQMLATPSAHWTFYSKMLRAFTTPESRMPSVFAALTMCGLPIPTVVRKPAINALMRRSGFGTNSIYESYASEEHGSDVDAFLAGLQRTDQRAIMRAFEAKNRSDFLGDLLNFRGPLTLVTADGDAFCPPSWLSRIAARARKSGVSAHFAVLDDCDHLSICQRPAAVAAAMVVWLDRPALS